MINCDEVKIINNKDGTYKVTLTGIQLNEKLCVMEYPNARIQISPLHVTYCGDSLTKIKKANQSIDINLFEVVEKNEKNEKNLFSIYVDKEKQYE